MTKRLIHTLEWLKERVIVTESGCWQWTNAISVDGYGFLSTRRPSGAQTNKSAHRLAHELAIGPIPDGYQVDHVCHTYDLSCLGGRACMHRRCVNPAHLEAVTPRENSLRSRSFAAKNFELTHCQRGHEFTPENTMRRVIGDHEGRQCRTCRRARQRRATKPVVQPPAVLS